MPRQKSHRDRVFQVIGEPGPGSTFVGYVRYSSELQNETSIVTQKRLIKEYADKKGWKLVDWYEEPEESAKYDSIEDRPKFARLLHDAGTRFQIVVCAFTNRWARSMEAGYASLSRLRRARVWWCTSDGLWDIDKIQQDGFDVAFAVDMQMNASYVRQLSKRTIAGKEDRARDGYHNGSVMFGYLSPLYPKAPDNAPSTWRPPRTPVRPDPETFPALVRIGELVAQGWSDRAIADELEKDGYLSKTARFGERLLTKDTIAAIRRSWFPCEFREGCGFGTVDTPAGELIEGKHVAAWPFELWQRMHEVKRSQYRRPTQAALKRPHEFSRIIVCAACRRPLRVGFGSNALPYYRDTSLERKLPCAAHGKLSVRSSLVRLQFGEILRSIELPEQWREAIIERCKAMEGVDDSDSERIRKRREELDAEQKRLISLFRKGYVTEEELDEEMEKIRIEQFRLPVPETRNTDKTIQEALSAGETLKGMADYWMEAVEEERRDIVWSLLYIEGLIYDLEHHIIVGIRPRPGVLPVLSLGLEATSMWELRGDSLWLREDLLPTEQATPQKGRPPALTPAQREQAIILIRQGMPLQEIAKRFETSYEVIRRLARDEQIELHRGRRKLTVGQLEEAYDLLRTGASLQQVSQQFGISDESLRRLAIRDGVELSTRTPTERKLTPAQQEAARNLVRLGVSLRQTAKQFGISRCALEGLLKDEMSELQLQTPKLTAEQLEEAHLLLDAGVSLRQAAKSIGTTHYTLIRYLKKEGNNGRYEDK